MDEANKIELNRSHETATTSNNIPIESCSKELLPSTYNDINGFSTSTNNVLVSKSPVTVKYPNASDGHIKDSKDLETCKKSTMQSLSQQTGDTYKNRKNIKEKFKKAINPLLSIGRGTVNKTEKSPDFFPFLGIAIAAPAYMMQNSRGQRPVNIEHFEQELGMTIFRIDLKYGDCTWSIYRRLYDFLKLHSVLKVRYYQRKLPETPKFPDQFNYALQKVRHGRNPRFSEVETHRKNELTSYLKRVFKKMTLRQSLELCTFLEISGMSFSKGVFFKGKEGLMDVRVVNKTLSKCLPMQINMWRTYWVILKDSYIIISNSVADVEPKSVFFFGPDLMLTRDSINKLSPIKEYKLTLNDINQSLLLRGDGHKQMDEWTKQLRACIEDSPYTKLNRFDSYAPIRENQWAQWYIDAKDYFSDIADAISNAKDTIYIQDWWLSPEIYLKRPASKNEQFRLDRLLLKKAQDGVQIYLMVYKEVAISLPNDSQHTKTALKKLHRNIMVQRHPDHIQKATLFWAHHEKCVVVDDKIAFVGGLDLCFGRYDDNEHKLCDFHPTNKNKSVWVGQDYSNARIKDFINVRDHKLELIDRKRFPRMGWHDVAVSFTGNSARDVSRHFTQRWNWVKSVKANNRAHVKYLLPKTEGCFGEEPPYEYIKIQNPTSKNKIQVLRSSSNWSSGISTENSIYNAYIDSILNAQWLVYIENQFFISSTLEDENGTIKNNIAKAIVDRIYRAYQEKKKFLVIIIMPLIPAFESEVNASTASTIRVIMHYQYATMTRGPYSIVEQLREKGVSNPTDYIRFHGLRNYDTIPYSKLEPSDPLNDEIVKKEVQFKERDPDEGLVDKVKRKTEDKQRKRRNKRNMNSDSLMYGNKFSQGTAGQLFSNDDEDPQVNVEVKKQKEEGLLSPILNKFKNHKGSLKPSSKTSVKAKTDYPLSQNTNSLQTTDFTQSKTPKFLLTRSKSISEIGRSVRKLNKKFRTKLNKESSSSSEESSKSQSSDDYDSDQDILDQLQSPHIECDLKSELTGNQPKAHFAQPASQFITEELYVHSKLLIVDDKKIIIGSANINDRSMLGFRDSEIAVIIEDVDYIKTEMDGVEVQVGRLAHEFRINLFKEHLGLLDHEDKNPEGQYLDEMNRIIGDPLSDKFMKLWIELSKSNTEIFRRIFRCVPDDTVRTWNQFKEFVPNPRCVLTGHPNLMDTTLSPKEIDSKLALVKGHLVDFPTQFLDGENLLNNSRTIESLLPLDVFV